MSDFNTANELAEDGDSATYCDGCNDEAKEPGAVEEL